MSVLFVNDTRVTALPADWPALASHGTEAWQWRILDRSLRNVGVLEDVTGGKLDFNVAADTRGSGSVSWIGAKADQPDWVNILLQPWYTLTSPDGTTVSWPLGVFLPSTPRVLYDDAGTVSIEVDLYDRTLRLRQQAFAYDPYVVPVGGSTLSAFVREVIGFGGLQHVIEDTDKTARTPMTFMPGTTYMEVVNTILDAAGFFAVYADGDGVMRSQAYQPPAQRPVVWTFTDGDASTFAPLVPVEQDWFSVPNRLLVFAQETGDEPPLFAEAYNHDTSDPLSIPNRGYVTEVVEGVDAADYATLQDHADRLMAERRGKGATVELEHLPLPLSVNDRVDLAYDAAELHLAGAVQTVSIDCRPGALWRTTIREVAA